MSGKVDWVKQINLNWYTCLIMNKIGTVQVFLLLIITTDPRLINMSSTKTKKFYEMMGKYYERRLLKKDLCETTGVGSSGQSMPQWWQLRWVPRTHWDSHDPYCHTTKISVSDGHTTKISERQEHVLGPVQRSCWTLKLLRYTGQQADPRRRCKKTR